MEQSPSKESEELELLERVFLKFGGAETDEQFQSTLERFLVPTILKSSSPYKSVQNKVLEILTHINKRLHSRPTVLLPMTTLLARFSDHDSSPQAANFSLVYIKLGFHRLVGTQQAALLPQLVSCLDGKRTQQQQDSILKLFVSSLVHFTFTKDVSKRKDVFSLDSKPQIRRVLLEFLESYLLLPYGQPDSASSRGPAGLSMDMLHRLTGKEYLKPEELEKVKLAILKFLSSEIFSADECLTHFIIATSDPKHSIADEGDRLLKQFSSSAQLENNTLISHIYSLYLGTVVTPGKRPHPQTVDLRQNRSAASLRLRLRLLPYLTKSTLAANSFPSAVQVIFDGLFGEVTSSKLKIQSLQFVQHICSKASDQKLGVMAPVILTGLKKIVDQPPEDPKLHVLSYVAIGSLAKRSPALFVKDTKHLTKIFNSLQKDMSQDLSLAVQECLNLMAVAYRGVKGQSAMIVEALILENIYSEVTSARLAAVHYACSVFPFHHVPSRFVCMVACGDSKGEVRDEGRKGLIPPAADNEMGWDEKARAAPDFCDMLLYFHRQASLAKQSGSVYSTAAGKLPLHPHILTEAFRFLRLCLSHSAGVTSEHKVMGTSLPLLVKYLAAVASTDGNTCLSNYLELLKESLGPAGDGDLHSVAMEALLELTAAAPPLMISSALLPDIKWIKGFTHSSRAETREPAARLFGILAQGLEKKEFLQLAEAVLRNTSDPNYGIQHGAVVSLGYITAVLVQNLSQQISSESPSLQEVELIRQSLTRLVELMRGHQSSAPSASACRALGAVFRSGPLPLPVGGEGRGTSAEGSGTSAEGSGLSKAGLVASLAEMIKKAGDKQTKLKEQCVQTLGYLSVGEPLFPLKEAVMAALLKLKEEKAVELQFSVGEAIACTLAGPLSPLAHDPWKLSSVQESDVTFDPEGMPRALEDILSHYAVGTSPVVRQSTCIWLLCLLKHAGKHPGIQDYLKRIQMVFMDMLSEQSEVTQEVASRGMGVVYEMSAEGERGELVETLVGTFMEGRRSSAKVTGDTELFQKGQLGKDPKGGSLSTYKELCSLASDMNKPDLVYKFMSLANHNALWNSKKGAAYGFSTIAAHAQEQLAPYLPNIVPRLYRYKYDPSPGIQLAMSNIWSAIVPDSKRAVDKYLKEIMTDLVANLNSSLWRNRQSSCVALSDLLAGRQVGEVADYIPRLWELVLRVRDDIKETVRKAAGIACDALHKITVRACDGVTMTTTGGKVVEGVLPVLLKNGLTNPSDEIKAISLRSILKISKNAGVLLKPHVAVLIPSLLESLSSLENQQLNTVSMMYSEHQETIDNIRVSATKSSPMMETVQLCVPQVGPEELPSLVPCLVEVMKSGVGLATKVASAQFVVLLVHHCLSDLTPFAGKLMNALVAGLSDRNSAVRKACAKSIGHLVKVSKDTTVTKMITKLKTRYFEKDDSLLQNSSAYVFHAMATYSLDTTKRFSSDILPLVFLAMHAKPPDEDKELAAVVSKWKDTWEELVPGTQAGVRLHLTELMDVVCPSLGSQSWSIKRQAAAAVATITETLGAQLGAKPLISLLSSLLQALQGRIWDGKTMLLKALSTMCKSCSESLMSVSTPLDNLPAPSVSEGALTQQIAQVVRTQCLKKDVVYKRAALECLGDVLEQLKVDVFISCYGDIILPILEQKGEDDSDDEDHRTSATAKLDLQVKAFLLVGQAWPVDSSIQRDYYARVMMLLTDSLPRNNWKVQVAILSSISALFEKMKHCLDEDQSRHLCEETLVAVCQCIGDVKYGAVRNRALLSVQAVVTYHKGLVGTSLPATTVSLLLSSLESITDTQLRDRANKIIQTIKQLPQ